MAIQFLNHTPAEIRDKIYEAFFEDLVIYIHRDGCTSTNNIRHLHGTYRADKHALLNLYLTCRTIYQDASPYFFKLATFELAGCFANADHACQPESNRELLRRIVSNATKLQVKGVADLSVLNLDPMVKNVEMPQKLRKLVVLLYRFADLDRLIAEYFSAYKTTCEDFEAYLWMRCNIRSPSYGGPKCLMRMTRDSRGKVQLSTERQKDLDEAKRVISWTHETAVPKEIDYVVQDVYSLWPGRTDPYFNADDISNGTN